jgi:hypothetical protein
MTIIVEIATNTHSEYVILIAFPLQQSLHKRAAILRYTYIVCLVKFLVNFVEMCSVYMPVYLTSSLLIFSLFQMKLKHVSLVYSDAEFSVYC